MTKCSVRQSGRNCGKTLTLFNSIMDKITLTASSLEKSTGKPPTELYLGINEFGEFKRYFKGYEMDIDPNTFMPTSINGFNVHRVLAEESHLSLGYKIVDIS